MPHRYVLQTINGVIVDRELEGVINGSAAQGWKLVSVVTNLPSPPLPQNTILFWEVPASRA